MGRSGSLVLFVGVMLAGLSLPAASLASTYSWNLPANFTASPPGANPDHDSYSGAPWSYLDAAEVPVDRPSFRPLPAFTSPVRGGLAGWTDPNAADTLVAASPSNTALTDGTDIFPAGQLVMTPGFGREVAVGWTSPLSHAATVNVTGSVSSADPNNCLATGKFTWSLDDQNGVSLQSGGSTDTISVSPAVGPGQNLYLIVHPTVLHNVACDTALVSLHIATTETAGPQVTLKRPGNGALITGGQPTFSGSASTAFGASPTVTVRIYSGAGATGTPLQTVAATRSAGGGYTVGPNADLSDGQYTAQAEQDDLASPADVGLSPPSTFVVHNAAPVITLKSLGTKPLHNATPSVAGVVGSASGDSHTVVLRIYPGGNTNATPVRYLTSPVDSHRNFSIKVSPALPDGQYTAVVAQDGALAAGLSRPMTFRIKVHAPVVTVTRPVRGSSTSQTALSFSGSAGTALGDSSSITVLLYAGPRAHGKALFTLRGRAHGGAWTAPLKPALKLGLYTAVAKQSDDAGHIGVSRSDTFLLVAGPTVVGATVKLSPTGAVSVQITCLAPAGQLCAGTVLILTERSLQPLAGGPSGEVRLLFAYLSIPGGKTELVTRTMRADVARALRGHGSVRVRVSAKLTGGARANVLRSLRFGR